MFDRCSYTLLMEASANDLAGFDVRFDLGRCSGPVWAMKKTRVSVGDVGQGQAMIYLGRVYDTY